MHPRVTANGFHVILDTVPRLAVTAHLARLPSVGSGEYCALDSFVDLGTVFACLRHLLPHLFCSLFFLIYLLPYLSFPLRIDPLRLQAGGRKRQPNLGFLVVLIYFML